jgi:hypothetical protein
MKYNGPLGFPRLTGIGPFTTKKSSYSTLDDTIVSEAVIFALQEKGYPEDNFLDELNDSEMEEISEIIADVIFATDVDPDPVVEAKKDRFVNCMMNEWVDLWLEGVEDSEETETSFRNDKERLEFMVKGCYGITNSRTATEPEFLPEEYTE